MKSRIKLIRHSLVLGILICLFLIYSPGWAVDYTWSGGGGGNPFLSVGANWVGGVAPGAVINGSMFFGLSANYIAVNMPYNPMSGIQGISFTAGGTSGYIISGNSLSFAASGATIGGNSTLAQTINAPIISNGPGGIVTNSDTFNLTLSGVISGAGALTQSGAKTLTLSGTNTYTGATNINAGKVSIGADSRLGRAPVVATAGHLTFGGGTLESSGTFTLNANRGIALTGAGTIDVDAGRTLTYGGIIAGASTLTKTDTGTLSLGGTNIYTGATNINAGTLTVTADQALGTNAAGTTVANNATLGISGGINYAVTEALTLNGAGAAGMSGALDNITGDNTFAGAITLASASTIGSTAGTLTASGAINNGGFLLTVGGAGDETLSGIISGAGALTKSGAGLLTLTGTNTYNGGTTVSVGGLTGTTSSLQGNIANNATVTFDQAGDGTYAGVMSGTGTLTKLSNGNVTLSGANIYSGGTTVTAGTLTGTTTSLQNAITNNAAVVFDQAGSGTYAGIMSGTGALTKTGAGTLTLSGNNIHTGLTTLSAGGLILSGRVGGDLTVAGGILSGTGTIGGTLTLAGSTCSPGNSIGTMTVLNDYVQNAGSTLDVEVEKTSSGTLRSDLLDVSGSATLAAGSTISVTDLSSGSRLIGTGDTFTIIQTGTGVTDNGASITSNSAVLSFASLVSGNNYQLVATREAFAANVSGENRSGVLGAIDSDLGSATGDYITLINALTALNSVQLNDAAEKLNPLPHASATKVSLITTQRMAGNLANYLSARRSGIEELMMLNTKSRENQLLIADASNDPRTLAYVINENKRLAKIQQDEADSKIRGFLRPFGVFYDQDSTPELTGFRAKAVGTQFGFDKSYGPNLIMGIGGGYSHSFINFKESHGEGDTDSFRVGPYATYFKDNFFIDTSVTLGYHENENKRSIKFGTINRTAKSNYHAYDLSAYIGGGYDFHVNEWTVTPTTSFQYIRYRNESFKETGAGAAGLDVDAATSQSLRGKLGVALSTVTELYQTKIVPELFVGWAHEFIDDEDIKARFVQGTAKFTTDVDDNRDDSVYFGAGISALLRENISAFVRYEGEYSSGNKINALSVGITVLF